MFHSFPGFPIFFCQAVSAKRAVKNIRIDVIEVQMLEGVFKRLPHLDRIWSIFVIGLSVILSLSKSKLRLNKEIFSFLDSSLQEPLDGSAHTFFMIMLSLIRCVDPGE